LLSPTKGRALSRAHGRPTISNYSTEKRDVTITDNANDYCRGADLSHKKETLHERISRRINKAKQQVEYQAKLYNKQVKARAITRTRVKQEQVIEYQVCTINIIEVEYEKKIMILKKDVML